MNAGLMTERFAFDKRNTVKDDYGNEQGEWVEQHLCWTRRQFLRGGEDVIAARLEGRQPALLTIRSSVMAQQITTDWRARDTRTGDLYNIREVKLTEDRAHLEILAERGVASG